MAEKKKLDWGIVFVCLVLGAVVILLLRRTRNVEKQILKLNKEKEKRLTDRDVDDIVEYHLQHRFPQPYPWVQQQYQVPQTQTGVSNLEKVRQVELPTVPTRHEGEAIHSRLSSNCTEGSCSSEKPTQVVEPIQLTEVVELKEVTIHTTPGIVESRVQQEEPNLDEEKISMEIINGPSLYEDTTEGSEHEDDLENSVQETLQYIQNSNTSPEVEEDFQLKFLTDTQEEEEKEEISTVDVE